MTFSFFRNHRYAYILVMIFLIIPIFQSSCTTATEIIEPGFTAVSVTATQVSPLEDSKVEATEIPGKATVESPQAPISVSPTVANHPGFNLVSFASDNFVGSANCALCHSRLVDEAGNDVSNDSHWRSAMMANSAKDPFWQAKVSSEVARNPELAAIIEDKCANCHTPMAHTEAKANGETLTLLGEGVLQSNHSQHVSAMDGVSCTLCHQIQDHLLGEMDSFSGGYTIDTDAIPPDRPIFGPYTDQFEQLMINMVGYTPVFGEQTLDSGLCATCHTLYTPYVDAAGNILGEFPEQTPYLEWENSIYGDGISEDVICQECHMPEAEGTVVISNMPQGRQLIPRSPFAQHHFVGGNTFMLKILQGRVEELGLTASSDHFVATIARTLNQLQRNTAEISILMANSEGETMNIVLEVMNKAGHKFPTGFPARRAWIHLVVENANGEIVFDSGKPVADGSIMGNDGDENTLSFEPHYEIISSPDQVQIYESIMHNSDGEITFTLLRGAGYAKDNRLLPEGFDKEQALKDIAVLGSAADDENFTGGSDMVEYEIDLKGSAGPFRVTAELLYQSVSYSFVQDLLDDRIDQVNLFIGFFNGSDRFPVLIAMDQKAVE
jgi:hypothetical protein